MQTMIAAQAEVTTAPKARKRVVNKSPKPQASERLTVYVTEKQLRVFATHALFMGMDRSQYVQWLIDTHCNRFVVSDRSKTMSGPPDDRAKPDASATQEVSAS